MKLHCSARDQSSVFVSLLTATHANAMSCVDMTGDEKEPKLALTESLVFTRDVAIAREIARAAAPSLLGASFVQRAQIDSWCTLYETFTCNGHDAKQLVDLVEKGLKSATSLFLVGTARTLADFAAFAALHVNRAHLPVDGVVLRFYESIFADARFKSIIDKVSSSSTTTAKPTRDGGETKQQRDEGKFVELPGAERGKVVVRFPPEASGYLHIGHAKAALLNQYYQVAFEGQLIMRFDDTNPAKENAEFEKVILEDLKLLQIKPDRWTHTSDHFDKLLELCEQLLRENKAYVDDTDAETMKQEREARKESAKRSQAVEKNLATWQEMKKGSAAGQRCAVRMKIDMQADNGCLRDPTIYRCKPEHHVRTGNKYAVYPTYDFACPIVDSLEGVTHALRTTEYHDRDAQYYFILDALSMRKPHIWSYARLNMTNTIMSKRKLTWLVDEGYVDGWDDPRMPTVRGVRRRGLTVDGLKQFIVAQGGSRATVVMTWDKIWAFNKKVIDPVAPRYTALLQSNVANVAVQNVNKAVEKEVPLHPKDPAVGSKKVWQNSNVLIEGEDIALLKENTMATFINWGNLEIQKVSQNQVTANARLDNTDYKKTAKLTWLASGADIPSHVQPIPVVCVDFEHIISKDVLGKDEDFKTYVNTESKTYSKMLGEPALGSVRAGDIIQLQRRGYYICDRSYVKQDVHTGVESPCVLFRIPDGSTKEAPTSGSTVTKSKSQSVAKSKTTSGSGGGGGDKKTNLHASSKPAPSSACSSAAGSLALEVQQQGDKLRQLKAAKTTKAALQPEVDRLLSLKAQYKEMTGADWTPDAVKNDQTATANGGGSGPPGSAADLGALIAAQGNKVRDMKAAKADKAAVKQEVDALLKLKADYKAVTGADWTPGAAAAPVEAKKKCTQPGHCGPEDDVVENIKAQGDKIRALKQAKGDKDAIQAEVSVLLKLKEEYKQITGKDYVAEGGGPPARQQKSEKQPQKQKEKQPQQQQKQKEKQPQKKKDAAGDVEEAGAKKQTRLGLEVGKDEDFAEWYSQVITKAELLDYYDVSGCYVIRPWAFAIWENITRWFDAEIKKLGVDNVYFPMFVSHAALEKEKTHIADFAPEVAWVTKSGQSEMAEPIAIRPTSETVMYPTFAKWIQSYRDLPLRCNQWCNVVRWEFKHPTPFIRTREFLWQEGHTAWASKEDAQQEVYTILDLYAAVYIDLLAIPVIKGRKTEKEKFAGGDFTTTIEVYIATNGRAVQAATSHHLGQNFAKMFEIVYEHPETGEKAFVYQNSWGLTTRSLGVMTMVHGDDRGLVLPPRVAKIQAIIIPCGIKASTDESVEKNLIETCQNLKQRLNDVGIRADCDLRDNYSPPWKFNHWELKGVPLRIELGPRDLEKSQIVVVRRDDADNKRVEVSLQWADGRIEMMLKEMHIDMYERAKKQRDAKLEVVDDWEAFLEALSRKCIIMAPFCGGEECEAWIKADSAQTEGGEETLMGAKGLCIPFEQPRSADGKHCVHPKCKNVAQSYTLFGRSY